MDTYQIAFFKEQFDAAAIPRWPMYIAIISPGKQPETG